MIVEDDDDDKKKEKKIILVGIRIDRNGRDLLNWALARVAQAGDHVIALHVCRNSDPMLMENFTLDSYLDVFKDLCSVKKIDLRGKISHGSSVRKVLVMEAEVCDAMVVVLGVSRREHSHGSWVYVAENCSKNLPSTTSILAVHNGRIVFERGLTDHSPEMKSNSRPSFYPVPLLSLKETTESESPRTVQSTEDGSRDCENIKKAGFRLSQDNKEEASSSSICGSDGRKHNRVRLDQLFEEEIPLSLVPSLSSATTKDQPDSEPGWPLLQRFSLRSVTTTEPTECKMGWPLLRNCYLRRSATRREKSESRPGWPLLRNYIRRSVITEEQPESRLGWPLLRSSSLRRSATTKDQQESNPGWPLLRSATSWTQNKLREKEDRRMSVVQWVLSLPNRPDLSSPESQLDFDSDKTENQPTSIKNSLWAWGDLPREMELLVRTTSSNCRWFSHNELSDATSQFASENLIGKGGCSCVYKGFLSDGKSVAVKVLKVSREAWQDFILEIDIISSLKHKNIAPLIGVCVDTEDLILVYEFFSKGSLEDNLQDKKEKHGLSWEVRFNVAIGIAEAISYLHNECSRAVIHRDVKSSNVLLSEEFGPQLSDFGLAMWAPKSSAEEQFGIVGTFGYLAPEYFMYGKVSDKTDVYSFGVLLLELLSGRKPISSEPPKGQESLVIWAKPMIESGDISGILDPDLTGKFDEVKLQRMVQAVTLCIAKTTRLRPEMKMIVKLLTGENGIEEWVNCALRDLKEANEDQEGDGVYPDSSVESHLALLDLNEYYDTTSTTTTSFSSFEPNNHHSLEDYLKGRWSRSSSFNLLPYTHIF